MDGRQHAQDQGIVQLVDVEPLSEYTVVREILADPAVELGGEEPRDSADPRVGRLRHDEVEPPVRRCEIGLGVVDHDLRARVVERAPVRRKEDARARDHLGSISMVTRLLSVGLPSSRCDDIPEPCPITAADCAPRHVRQSDERKQGLRGGIGHERHRRG